MPNHKKCYGKMFHDSLHFTTNKKMMGKAFSFELDTAGLAPLSRNVEENLKEWDDCLACNEFDHCYKLGIAKLILEVAVAKT